MNDKERALKDMQESIEFQVRRKQQIHEAVPIVNGGASTPDRGTTLTDLQCTKLCAVAMGYQTLVSNDGPPITVWLGSQAGLSYHPLMDGAQAFALIEKFGLSVWGHGYAGGDWKYHAEWGHPDDYHALGHGLTHNEAIVRCIATMQLDRTARETSTVEQTNERTD